MKKAKYHEEYDCPERISDKRLQEILEFYVLYSPVPGTSVRGKTFKEYGFERSPAFSALKKELLKRASDSLKSNYWPCKKKEELGPRFQMAESVAPPDEYCCFLASDNQTVALFRAIRNAFAHGSFNVKSYSRTRIYFLVNYKDYQKAQIVLREDTLLAWIKVVQDGYDALRQQKNDQIRG